MQDAKPSIVCPYFRPQTFAVQKKSHAPAKLLFSLPFFCLNLALLYSKPSNGLPEHLAKPHILSMEAPWDWPCPPLQVHLQTIPPLSVIPAILVFPCFLNMWNSFLCQDLGACYSFGLNFSSLRRWHGWCLLALCV